MSKVFFSDMRTGQQENLFDKIAKLLTLAGLPHTVAAGDLTAVKIHFGEKGNRGYIKGTPPPPEDKTGRKRPFIAVDVDLPRTSKEAGVPETRMVNLSKPSAAKSSQEQAPVQAENVK